MSFDYVVLGAGSAGCVIAHRLSEDPDCRVLLVEAGDAATHPFVSIPGAAAALEGTNIDWAFRTVPQRNLNDRRIDYPRGRCLGGSSAINYSLYVRGNRGDYDHWRQLGNTGWGYDGVLPYFKRAEANNDIMDGYHGADGPLSVESFAYRNSLHEIYLEAAQSVGLPLNPDFNGATQEGCGYYQSTLKGGRRCHAADAYLSPIRDRMNLTVLTGTLITKLLVERGKVRGVEYIDHGRSVECVTAEIEVVCCAGSIGSPHLLMLSGIGPADHLREHGIDVIADLPGVGRNLLDHFGRAPVSFTIEDPDKFGFAAGSLDTHAGQFDRDGTGPLTSMHVDAGAFCRLRAEDAYPSAQLFFMPGYTERHKSVDGRFTVHLGGYVCRPQSMGAVTLTSSNPLDRPLIDPKYLSFADDLERTVELLQKNVEIAEAKPFDGVRGRMARDLGSRKKIVDHIRAYGATIWHPTSTCRMGVDEHAVVGPDLMVRGVEGLRVCDASVMPTMVSGNTNAPTIMIAEKGADLIRSRSAMSTAQI